jgi:hypothetical protein
MTTSASAIAFRHAHASRSGGPDGEDRDPVHAELEELVAIQLAFVSAMRPVVSFVAGRRMAALSVIRARG